MSGKRGIKHFGESIIKEVLQMKESGMTNREIAEHFNLRNTKAVKNLVSSHNRKQRSLETGIVFRPKGRPRKGTSLTCETFSCNVDPKGWNPGRNLSLLS
ncbi:hypothetical protein ACPUYX_20490 [Desulfosporosinus sp. SYSU MS00001]|uniref:hypothetical protein n=1 Tax=Desulfosporosinus sp. SYSU MS00001 TaxID=3416284 RepID=UPI003CF09729